jgi:hypothetical protein
VALLVLGHAVCVGAQTTTAIRGIVTDPQGSAVPGATVTVRQPSSGLERLTVSGADGSFDVANLPVGVFVLGVELAGFEPVTRRVDAPTGAPVLVPVSLQVAALTDQIVVTPPTPLVDQSSAGTRHAVSITRIERLPVAVSSRGLEAVLVSFPGFSQNANGAIHPRGAHNQMTFVLDGLPISDQLTGAFANSLDTSVVQTAEVITSNVPAEFGSKVSAVAVLNSRSGLGTGRPVAGSLAVSAGGFGTAQTSVQLGGERGAVAYFGSVTAMRTDRFLDQVSLDNLHNSGQFARAFVRVDVRASSRDAVRLHAVGGRSGFELANLRSQQLAGQDQRQALGDLSVWMGHVRTIDEQSTLETTVGVRRTAAELLGSPGDTPVTAEQSRGLTTVTTSVRLSTMRAGQLIRLGGDLQRFPVRERFSMAITSARFNDPADPGFNPGLLPHDVTRGGTPFQFEDRRTGTQASAFIQSTLRVGRLSMNLGLRYDEYRFLVQGRQLQPRLGVAYQLPGRDLVLRASYNRNFQTPPNENLLLSSSEAASQLAPPSVRAALGGAHRPIQPERQDAYEAGVQFPIGRALTLDLTAYHKQSRDQQDNNNFFDTGIIFPTTLRRIRVTGAESRLTLLPRGGFSGTLSATTGRAVSTPPFTGGLFLGQDAVDLLSAGPFLIDHDQRLSVHGTMTWDGPGPWWVGGSVRYDGGLVANPSDPAQVAADPDFADLLPYVDLAARTPRVRPRTIVDVTSGLDLTGARGARTWAIQLQATNLTNRVALYNFQSVFVGTRLVQPRTISVRLVRHF